VKARHCGPPGDAQFETKSNNGTCTEISKPERDCSERLIAIWGFNFRGKLSGQHNDANVLRQPANRR
jgi:hypothetical protein